MRVTTPAPVWLSLTAVKAVAFVMALVMIVPPKPVIFKVFRAAADSVVMVAALADAAVAALLMVNVSISATVIAVWAALSTAAIVSESLEPEPEARAKVIAVVAVSAPKVTTPAAALVMENVPAPVFALTRVKPVLFVNRAMS